MYRVLAAKRGLPLRPETSGSGGDLTGLVVGFLFEIVMGLRAGGETVWKVGVYRKGDFLIRRVLKERLPAGEDPGQRLDELVSQIQQGLGVASALPAQ